MQNSYPALVRGPCTPTRYIKANARRTSTAPVNMVVFARDAPWAESRAMREEHGAEPNPPRGWRCRDAASWPERIRLAHGAHTRERSPRDETAPFAPSVLFDSAAWSSRMAEL